MNADDLTRLGAVGAEAEVAAGLVLIERGQHGAGLYVILNKPSREYTGNALLCEDVLLESGVTDLSVYDCVPGSELGVDLWVDTPNPPGYQGR